LPHGTCSNRRMRDRENNTAIYDGLFADCMCCE
jgi:hypothetical protein